ncbi:MAG: tetratricopeptide repeat protein [Candidatus Cloacimonetes bacterium]|nr:tetratricopeptide repeat protein [Candidatus Cloacimonadota bacterium]
MDKINKVLFQVKYQKDKNWLKVKKLLLETISEYPENAQLYQALAELYFSKKLYSKAIGAYTRLREIDKTDQEIPFKIANCFLSLREYKLAIDYYESSPIIFQELLYNKAYAYSRLGDYEQSIEIMKQLVKYPINSELPLIFLAELYFTQSNYHQAILYLNKAERMFGKQSTIFYLRGIAYSHLERWLKAYWEFKYADQMKMVNHHLYRGYGIACDKIGKTAEAIDLLLQSIKLSPKNTAGYLDLIRIYLENNRVMEAYTIIQHARKNLPASISLTLLYNQIMQKMENLSRKNN